MLSQDCLVPFETCVILLWTIKAYSKRGIDKQIRYITVIDAQIFRSN